jgi:hypothetical protein
MFEVHSQKFGAHQPQRRLSASDAPREARGVGRCRCLACMHTHALHAPARQEASAEREGGGRTGTSNELKLKKREGGSLTRMRVLHPLGLQ